MYTHPCVPPPIKRRKIEAEQSSFRRPMKRTEQEKQKTKFQKEMSGFAGRSFSLFFFLYLVALTSSWRAAPENQGAAHPLPNSLHTQKGDCAFLSNSPRTDLCRLIFFCSFFHRFVPSLFYPRLRARARPCAGPPFWLLFLMHLAIISGAWEVCCARDAIKLNMKLQTRLFHFLPPRRI